MPVRVAITLEGGVIQDISADTTDIEFLVVDYDTDGADPADENLKIVGGELAYVTHHEESTTWDEEMIELVFGGSGIWTRMMKTEPCVTTKRAPSGALFLCANYRDVWRAGFARFGRFRGFGRTPGSRRTAGACASCTQARNTR